MDSIKIKDASSSKKLLRESKNSPHSGRKITAKHLSDKGILPKYIHKTSQKSIKRKQPNFNSV